MLNLFQGIFDSTENVIAASDFLLCMAVSLLIGLLLAVFYSYRSQYTKSFLLTLALLPAVVCVIIMMVNGNIGAGVAVAGAFGLVRFRSAPGTAREIIALFAGMTAGLVTGMGYLAYAVLFILIFGAVLLLYERIGLGTHSGQPAEKTVHITIPENLDYSDVFEDLFAEYTGRHTLVMVKTTNMGSLYRLTYQVCLKDPKQEKELIDKLRCRNGNLEISISNKEMMQNEL